MSHAASDTSQKPLAPIVPFHVREGDAEILSVPGGAFYRFTSGTPGEPGRLIPLLAMKIEDASVALGGVSAETIRRFVAKGKLHPIRKHRHMVFSVEELQRFLREETSDEDDSR